MAKKKPRAENPRTDAERRARQCERISRALRVLQCIAGPGRWDVQALADELECSPRTVQRVLQTLAMAGVPYKFDPEARAYRVPATFRFPGIDQQSGHGKSALPAKQMLPIATKVLHDGERFIESLRALCKALAE